MNQNRCKGLLSGRWNAAWAAAWMAAAAGLANAQPVKPEGPVTPIPRQQFDIRYTVGEGVPLEVRLFYSDDRAQTWQFYGLDADRTSPVSFTAPHEGLFGFIVIARNNVGPSADDPVPGDKPMFWCFMDWHRPRVQITGPVPAVPFHGGAAEVVLKPGEPLKITYAALDDFLTEKPIRLEYRSVNDPAWKDIAVDQPNTGQFLWQAPDDFTESFYLRVTAIDQAGNVGLATTTREMRIERRSQAAQATGRGTDTVRTPPAGPSSADVPPPPRAPVDPLVRPDSLEPIPPPVGIREPVLPAIQPPVAQPGEPVGPKPTPGQPPEVRPDSVGAVIQPRRVLTEQEATSLFVAELTLPEPMSKQSVEAPLTKLRGAMQKLADRDMLVGPLGVALQPVKDSEELIKAVRVYGVVAPDYRQPDRLGELQAHVEKEAGQLEGRLMAFFPRPVEVSPQPGDPGQPVGPARGPVAPSLSGQAPSPVAPSASLPVAHPVGQPAQPAGPPPPRLDPSVAERADVVLAIDPRRPDIRVEPVRPAPVPTSPPVIQTPPRLPAPVPAIEPIVPAPPVENLTPVQAGSQPPRVSAVTSDPALTPPAIAQAGPPDQTPGVVAPPPRLPTEPTAPATPAGPTVAVGPATPSTLVGPTTPAPPDAPAPTLPGGPSPPAGTAGATPSLPIGPSPAGPSAVTPAASDSIVAAREAFRQALAAQAAKDIPSALRLYTQAVQTDPNLVAAWVNLAGVQMLERDYVSAELNYQRATELAPGQADAWFGLGSVQLLRNNPRGAQQALAQAVKAAPTDATAWVVYGDACIAVKENARAVAAWAEAARLAPGTAVGKAAQDRLARYGRSSN